ncbi:MAG: AMP-binding protein, partial [Acidimicrobiales bacterium]
MTIRDHLERARIVYGDRVGIYDEPDQPAPSLGDLTYGQFYDLAQGMAAGLDDLGLEQGARVGIVSQNSARLLTTLFGASAWGRVAVPINFRLGPDEVEYIVDHSGCDVLILDPELEDTLGDIKVKHRFISGEESDSLFKVGAEARPWTPDENATATINYTSG